MPAGAPITRILDCAVYLRPARGGLMAGGFEAAAEHRGGLVTMSPDGRFLVRRITGGHPEVDLSPLSPARFGGVLTGEALAERGTWQYEHDDDPLTA